MLPSKNQNLVKLLLNIYSFAQKIYPSGYMRQYGEDMQLTFSEQLQHVYQIRGAIAAVYITIASVIDVAWAGIKQRLAQDSGLLFYSLLMVLVMKITRHFEFYWYPQLNEHFGLTSSGWFWVGVDILNYLEFLELLLFAFLIYRFIRNTKSIAMVVAIELLILGVFYLGDLEYVTIQDYVVLGLHMDMFSDFTWWLMSLIRNSIRIYLPVTFAYIVTRHLLQSKIIVRARS